MAYETLLNTPTLITGAPVSTLNVNGLSSTMFFNISGTTLGDQLNDDGLRLSFNTFVTAASTLSAIDASTISLTLTSASFANQVYTGYIQSSSWSVTSAAIVIGFNSPNLGTTFVSLTASGSSLGLNPRATNTMDNWFYFSTVPTPAANRGVRTTLGHARLVSYLG
jgi:hypothetical protein